MSIKQVQASEPIQPDIPATVQANGETFVDYKVTVASFPCDLYYSFARDKLVGAIYAFNEEHSDDNRYLSDFEDLKGILREKYGPSKDGEIWSNDLLRAKPSEYGAAVSFGYLKKSSVWTTGRSYIILTITGDNFKIQLSILYRSVELGGLVGIDGQKQNMKVF